MTVITSKGDLVQRALDGEFDVIAHGCNCKCQMGAGLAKAVKSAFPAAYEADCRTEKGSYEKLGTCSFAECAIPAGTVTIVNCYTQYGWGKKKDGSPQVDYEAVRDCMQWLRKRFTGKRIGLPKIGAGLAGGDWETVLRIIEEELGDEDVTIVEYKQ